MATKKKAKKKNAQDLTLRNLRAVKKDIAELKGIVGWLMVAVSQMGRELDTPRDERGKR